MDALQARRLSWRCRRGMLELDLLLAGLAARLAAGEDVEQAEALLACDDSRLWEVLVAGSRPADREFADLAGRLRQDSGCIAGDGGRRE